MENEQKIKGILVEFFRNGTNCDYLNALNIAIRDIKALSQHDVMGSNSQSNIKAKVVNIDTNYGDINL